MLGRVTAHMLNSLTKRQPPAAQTVLVNFPALHIQSMEPIDA